MIKYKEIKRWEWTCPKCGRWKEEDENPQDKEALVCEIGHKFTEFEEE